MVVLFRGWVGRGNRELLYEYRVSVLQVLRLVAQQYEYTYHDCTELVKIVQMVKCVSCILPQSLNTQVPGPWAQRSRLGHLEKDSGICF